MKLNEVVENRIVIPGDNRKNRYFAYDEICRKIKTTNYPKYTIFDVKGNIDFVNIDPINELPVHFGEIEGSLDCSDNSLKNLDRFPSIIRDGLNFKGNKITSLVGINKIIKYTKWIDLTNNPIEEGGIGLLLIEGLETVFNGNKSNDFKIAVNIITKYLGKGKHGLLNCQNELEEAGLERFAKL